MVPVKKIQEALKRTEKVSKRFQKHIEKLRDEVEEAEWILTRSCAYSMEIVPSSEPGFLTDSTS